MKFTKIILTAVAVATIGAQSFAATIGFDAYAALRTVLPSTTPTAIAAANGAGGITNGPIDTLNWIGDGKIDAFAYTNAQLNTVKLTVNGSPDCTNWTQVTTLSLAGASSLNITNSYLLSGGSYFYNTNFFVTDYYLYPFTVTTPVASASLFNTPYAYENPFTNGTVTLSGNGVTEVGFHGYNLPRYLQLVWQASGTGTTNVITFSTITVPTTNVQP